MTFSLYMLNFILKNIIKNKILYLIIIIKIDKTNYNFNSLYTALIASRKYNVFSFIHSAFNLCN